MQRLVIACVLILSSRGHADPEVTRHKDPEIATLLAVAGTIVPLVLIVGGASADQDLVLQAGLYSSFVGPSIGHWYAGQYLTAGMGIRAAGAAVAIAGLAQSVFGCPWFDSDDGGGSCTKGDGLLIAGGVIYAAGAIYDIATAGSAARRWNEHRLQIAPTIVNHGPPGLALTGMF